MTVIYVGRSFGRLLRSTLGMENMGVEYNSERNYETRHGYGNTWLLRASTLEHQTSVFGLGWHYWDLLLFHFNFFLSFSFASDNVH